MSVVLIQARSLVLSSSSETSLSGGGGGKTKHETEILGLHLNAADFMFSIFLFVVLHPLVDLLFSVAQHAEAGEHVGDAFLRNQPNEPIVST